MRKFIIGMLFLILFFTGTLTGEAVFEDNDSDISKGQITFYEEDDLSETQQTSHSPSTNTNKSNGASKTKTTGLLPQTGEDYLKLLPYLIGINLLILFLYYQKEKKETKV